MYLVDKFLIIAGVLLFSFNSVMGQNNATNYILSEDFSYGYIPYRWTVIDNDADENSWTSLRNYWSYKGLTFTDSTRFHSAPDALVSWSFLPDSLDCSEGIGLSCDNYLITPLLHIPSSGAELSFYVSTYNANHDSYSVLISTTSNNAEDFTATLIPITEAPDSCQQIIASLNQFAGQDIYIAFRHQDTNLSGLIIDDIYVEAEAYQQTCDDLDLCDFYVFVESESYYELSGTLEIYHENRLLESIHQMEMSTTKTFHFQSCSGSLKFVWVPSYTRNDHFTVKRFDEEIFDSDSIIFSESEPQILFTYGNEDCTGPERYNFRGIITDMNDNPIENARIQLSHDKNLYTDSIGYFEKNIATSEGNFNLSIFAEGYAFNENYPISLTSDTSVNIKMQKADFSTTQDDSCVYNNLNYLQDLDTTITISNTGDSDLEWYINQYYKPAEYLDLAPTRLNKITDKSNIIVENISNSMELLYQFETNQQGEQAVTTDGNYIFTASWLRENEINKYDKNGNFIETFYIPELGTIRNIAYNGQTFYVTRINGSLLNVDIYNRKIIGELSIDQTKTCSYNMYSQKLYLTNIWGELIETTEADLIDTTMTYIDSNLADVYSTAAYKDYIWAFEVTQQGNSPATKLSKYKIIFPNTELEETDIQLSLIENMIIGSDLTSKAGGLAISQSLVDGKIVLLANVQSSATNNKIYVYEVGKSPKYINLSQSSGTLSPGQSLDIDLNISGYYISPTTLDNNLNEGNLQIVFPKAQIQSKNLNITCEVENISTCPNPMELNVTPDSRYGCTISWDEINDPDIDYVNIYHYSDSVFPIAERLYENSYSDIFMSGEQCFNSRIVYKDGCVSSLSADACITIESPCSETFLISAESRNDSIKISWDVPFVVSKFEIYRDLSLIGETTNQYFYDLNIEFETSYQYMVRAIIEDENCEYISSQYAECGISNYICKDLSLTADYVENCILLVFNNITDADVLSYDIYRNGELYREDQTSQTFIDSNVLNDSSYCYYIEALCSMGIRNNSETICETVNVDEYSEKKISIFPNPAKDIMFISGSNIKNIEIINYIGQIVYSTQNDKEEISINTSNFDNGIYEIRATDENGFIIKEKICILK